MHRLLALALLAAFTFPSIADAAPWHHHHDRHPHHHHHHHHHGR